MAFGPDVEGALTRLQSYFNGNNYDPQTNPGGLRNGGHRINFPLSLTDVGLVVRAIGDLQNDVAEAQQAAKDLTDTLARASILLSVRFSGEDGNLAEGQTTLTVPGGYTPGIVLLYRNGSLLRTSDYTATDGSRVVLRTPARSDDVFDLRGYRGIAIANAAPAQHQHNVADVLGAVAHGAIGDEEVQATGLQTPHLLADWLKYPISLERFGCNGDFNGTTGTDNASAFATAVASGEELRLPAGKRYLIGGADPITERTISISGQGSGRSSALVFPSAAGDGLRIEQSSYRFATTIRDLALLTLGQEAGAALSVTYSAADSADARGDIRCLLDNLTVSGTNFTQAGWANGLVLTDVHNLTLSNPTIVGRRDATSARRAAFGKMGNAVRFIGTTAASIPSDALIDNPRVMNAQTGVLSEGYVEGLRVERPIFVGVWGGVRANYSNSRPWTRITGGHMNVFDYGVSLTNSPQSEIDALLIYKIQIANAGDPTGGRTFAVLLDACDLSTVSSLLLMNQAADAEANGAWDGVEIKNSNNCDVRNIKHERPSTGMKWSGTSSGGGSHLYKCVGTYAKAVPAEYADVTGNSTNFRSDGNKPAGSAANASAVTTTTAGVFAASLGINNCEVGQRYRLDVQLTATNGQTLGEIFYYLQNTGGSAVGRFAASALALKGRYNPFPAGAEHNATLSGIFTITQRGSLNMGLFIITPAGAATVPSGGAQITATLL